MAKLIKGINDLATLYPEVAQEWDYERNFPLSPDEVTAGSHKKIWWKCKQGHLFYTSIYNRTRGTNCPYCARKKPIKGVNDLLTVCPSIAKEWNYEKNIFGPDEVLPWSNKKVWWKCKEGHEYEARIQSRTNGRGCPYCARKKPIKGVNDLLTVCPSIAKEWNYEKNTFGPDEVLPWSNKKVWWKCKEGHEYEAQIYHRLCGTGCPYCTHQKVIKGVNDLLTVCPELAKEWNYEKNLFKPNEVSVGSGKKVWWKCEEGHEYEAIVGRRVKGSGCPYCSGRKAIKGINDLQTLFPDIAKEWNYEKNAFGPDEVTPWSNKFVWWKCEKNHEYRAMIATITRGNGCPYCARKKYKK